jgi:hypothetical protein
VPFYGIELQLDQSEFFSESGLLDLQRRKGNTLLHGSQYAGIRQNIRMTPARGYRDAMQTQILAIRKETVSGF